MANPSEPKKPTTVAPTRHDWAAAFLSYLVPGLGQIFQGRVGKGVLFLLCVYGLFFYGLALGNWQNVCLPRVSPYRSFRLGEPQLDALLSEGVPADVVSRLKQQRDKNGRLIVFDNDFGSKDAFLAALREVLTPAEVEQYRNRIFAAGGVKDDTRFPEVTLPLGITVPKPVAYRVPFLGQFWVGVVAWPALIQYWFYDEELDSDRPAPVLGKVMRTPTEEESNLMQNHNDKTWDLGWVYTVIAGVLNVMVIYDALVGPAYIPGAGDDKKQAARDKKTGAKDAAAARR